MGLAERLAAAAAATKAPAAAGVAKSDGIVGAANSMTMSAVNAAQLQAARAEAAVKPQKTSQDQVLFKTKRPHLGSATVRGQHFRFEYGYLLTSDADVIALVRENAALWMVTEEE